MRFILGPIIIIICVMMMKYTVQITNYTGKIDFAEKYLGTGFSGTYTWWRLIALVGIILSLMWMTGTLNITGNALFRDGVETETTESGL
jgi:hypothetical protein